MWCGRVKAPCSLPQTYLHTRQLLFVATNKSAEALPHQDTAVVDKLVSYLLLGRIGDREQRLFLLRKLVSEGTSIHGVILKDAEVVGVVL